MSYWLYFPLTSLLVMNHPHLKSQLRSDEESSISRPRRLTPGSSPLCDRGGHFSDEDGGAEGRTVNISQSPMWQAAVGASEDSWPSMSSHGSRSISAEWPRGTGQRGWGRGWDPWGRHCRLPSNHFQASLPAPKGLLDDAVNKPRPPRSCRRCAVTDLS